MGRNPATGEAIKIKASKKARITPLKGFKDAVMTPSHGAQAEQGRLARRPDVLGFGTNDQQFQSGPGGSPGPLAPEPQARGSSRGIRATASNPDIEGELDGAVRRNGDGHESGLNGTVRATRARRVRRGAAMPKVVVTHNVADVDTWLSFKAERVDAIAGLGGQRRRSRRRRRRQHRRRVRRCERRRRVQGGARSPPPGGGRGHGPHTASSRPWRSSSRVRARGMMRRPRHPAS